MSLRKKFLFALEDDNVELDLEKENETSSDEISELSNDVNDSNEIETISDTIEKIENTNNIEEVKEIATEYLYNRLGINRNQITMESFNSMVNKQLSISQEGVFSRIGNALKRMITTRKKMITKFNSALDKLKDNGSRDTVLKDPAWSKYLVYSDKDLIKAADVVNGFKKLHAFSIKPEIANYFKNAIVILQKISTEVSKGRFTADDEAVKNLHNMYSEVDKISANMYKFLSDNTSKHKDMYPNFEPIDYKTVKPISDLIIKNLTDQYQDYDNFSKVIEDFNNQIWSELQTRLLGVNAADMKAARKMLLQLNSVTMSIVEILDKLYYASYAIMRYMEDSSN